MMRIACGITAVTAVATLAVAASAAPRAEFQSRLVDRSFVCTAAATYGGLRNVDLWVAPRGRSYLGGETVSTGYLNVTTGPYGQSSSLVLAQAQLQSRGPLRPQPPGIYASARRCGAYGRRIPLSSRGLAGPPSVFPTYGSDCTLRGRVLVRVRALLQAPATWRRQDAPYVGVRRNVVSAALALRVESTGKTIAFMELDSKGKTRTWMSPVCR